MRRGAGSQWRPPGVETAIVSYHAAQEEPTCRERHLAAHFLEQPRPPAIVVPGPVTISIREWSEPTLGSRPHDPEPGPGGTIWWTGMFANVLGRFDPKNGEFKEFHAKTPASGPHGLDLDTDGNLWFTANSKGYIGKLDP